MLLFSDATMKDYTIMSFIIVFSILLIYYVIPYLKILREYIVTEKKKRERKDFINKIALQKDLEEEIEQELHI